jgi:hypothetical protein
VILPDSTLDTVETALRVQRYELQRWLHVKTSASEDNRANVRQQIAQLNLAIDTLTRREEH